MIKVRHSGNVGDLLYSIPFCIQLQEPIVFYLKCNTLAQYSPGMNHPCGDFRMTPEYAEITIPLLESQPWCKKAQLFNKESFDIDLDEFRKLPNFDVASIPMFYFWMLGGYFDLSQQWLFVKPDENYKDKIVVTRTNRYLNSHIDYSYLNPHKKKVVFLGLKNEYKRFEVECFECKHVQPENFLEVAQIIAGCKLFLSNQTANFAIAEGLKVERVLEIYKDAPNVIPMGKGGRYALHFRHWKRAVDAALGIEEPYFFDTMRKITP